MQALVYGEKMTPLIFYLLQESTVNVLDGMIQDKVEHQHNQNWLLVC